MVDDRIGSGASQPTTAIVAARQPIKMERILPPRR
jgi:hypothetical protein